MIGVSLLGALPALGEGLEANPDGIARFEAGPLKPATSALTVVSVWQWRPAATHFQLTDNRSDRREGEMTLSESPGATQTWRCERFGVRTETLSVAEDGSVKFEAMDIIEKGVIARFSPALTAAPAVLEPGKVYTSAAEMTIVDRQDTSHVKATGSAVMTVVYDADQPLATPAGKFDCHRVRLTCEADFGWGSMTIVSTFFYAEGAGLVAEEYDACNWLLFTRRVRHISAVLAAPPGTTAAREDERP